MTATARRPIRVAVLASGSGTTFQALAERLHGSVPRRVEIAVLVAGREGAGVLERAKKLAVPATVVAPGDAGNLLDVLSRYDTDLVVLAGYMSLVPSSVVAEYSGRMVNVHPALLPAFGGAGMYGSRVHAAVIEAGCRVSGATVHLVDDSYDTGPIVAQWPVPVFPDDTAEVLETRVRAVERVLLPRAVELLAEGAAVHPGGAEHFSLRHEVPAPDELIVTARTGALS